jgi:hypothetical protein
MPATTATSQRAGLRRRVEASPHAELVVTNDRAQGTCSFYPADAGGCRAPRSCYDCLNAVLEKEPGGCTINEIGRCVSAPENYDPALDFRVVPDAGLGVTSSSSGTTASSGLSEATQPPTQGPYELQFPASNTTYCEDDDNLFNEDGLADGGFTFGTGGCVFVAMCEAPNWAYIVGGSDCSGVIAAGWEGPAEDESRDDKGDSPQSYLVFWCVAIALLLTLVATLAMVITIHHHHSKRRIEELQRRRTIAVGEPIATAASCRTPKASKSGVRLLNLFGWEAMRADLIEKERHDMQERLCAQACQASENRLPGVSPSTNYLQFVGVQPSAPVMSPIVSSAPRLTDC